MPSNVSPGRARRIENTSQSTPRILRCCSSRQGWRKPVCEIGSICGADATGDGNGTDVRGTAFAVALATVPVGLPQLMQYLWSSCSCVPQYAQYISPPGFCLNYTLLPAGQFPTDRTGQPCFAPWRLCVEGFLARAALQHG